VSKCVQITLNSAHFDQNYIRYLHHGVARLSKLIHSVQGEPVSYRQQRKRMMTSKLLMSLMAGALLATPVLAIAQGNNPTGNMGSNRSDTSAGTNGDSAQKSGMGTADVKPGMNAPKPSGAAKDNTVPGATGRTVVPGSSNTVADDQSGTSAAKTGQTNTGSGK
jgi:hypothetical protein